MSQDAELAQLQADIALGLDIKQFMGTAIGKYMHARANAEIDEALEALKTAEAEDAKAIRRWQNQIAVAERVLGWLGEAVTNGENAETTFEQLG